MLRKVDIFIIVIIARNAVNRVRTKSIEYLTLVLL